tara:strand:+ start:312 stop:2537 length:2226 start_codon:yes stop_codon:yes gene_type:complete
MAGITADISTSSFKPLDLNEIMMVPLAKQKMEDEFLAGSGKVNEIEAQTLNKDQDRASQIMNEFKERASNLSQNVIEKGVSRSEFNRLRSLRQEVKGEYGSQGFLGNAMANKKAAGVFINELATKKERQAGWSPQEAKQWAIAQVYGNDSRGIEGFKGSQNEDGSFNSFSGKEMSTKVDEDKVIKDAVDSVAQDVTDSGLQYIRIGGLPAFQEAFASQKVSSKDYNKVMDAILTASATNPDLIASLKQQAFFTGEEDPFDMGEFTYKEVKDPVTGKMVTKRTFVQGKSRYGAKMAGAGRAGSYVNTDISEKILKNEVGFAMYQNNMEQQKIIDAIAFTDGEGNKITSESLESTQETLKLAKDEANNFLTKANARKKELMDGGMPEEEARLDQKYKRLNKSYIDNNTSFMNAQSRMNSLYKQVDEKVSKDDRAIFDTQDLLDKHGGDAIKALAEEFNLQVSKDFLSKGYQRDEGEEAHKILAKEMGVDMSKPGRGAGGRNTFPFILNGANGRRSDLTETYLHANPQAEFFTIIDSKSVGKFASKYGAWQDLKSGSNFNLASATLAYGKGSLQNSKELEDLESSTEGFGYRTSPTDGYDDDGNRFNNVIITNKQTGVSASVQVIDGQSNEMMLDLARDLQTGGFDQRKLGEQMEADLSHMKTIKKSGMLWQEDGQFQVNIGGGSERTAKYNKTEDGYYNLTIGGVPVELNGRTDLAGEKEVSLALFKEVRDINIYRESLKKKQ